MNLVTLMLDFTKEDFDGKPTMTYSEVNLKEEIQKLEPLFKMRAKLRKIDVKFDVDEHIPKIFMTDSGRIQ